MFLRVPGADLEKSLLLASGVSIAVGVASDAGQVLTGGVVVSGLIGDIRVADTHCRGGCRGLGCQLSHQMVVRIPSNGIQCSRRDLSKNPVWMPASRLAAADRVSGVSGAGGAGSRWFLAVHSQSLDDLKGVLFVGIHMRVCRFEERGRRLHRCVRRIDRPLALEAGDRQLGFDRSCHCATSQKVLAVSLFRPA